MVNYKAIADEAEQYSGYEAAYTAMSLEVTDEYKSLSSNELRTWAVENPVDYELLESSNKVIANIALKQINIDNSQMNTADINVRGMISALPISSEGITNLLSKAEIKVKIWQGLKPGHIQNALQKRAEGKV